MAIQENCQKSSQPHWKIVKKLHGHTGKLSNKYVGSWPYRKIVKKLHGRTGKLSNKYVGPWQYRKFSCMAVSFFDNFPVWPLQCENR